MQLIDCHSHTELSGHGVGTLAQAVSRAAEIGLSTYAQTEHLWLPEHVDPQSGDSMTNEQTEFYLNELTRLREQLKDQGSSMELIIGTEADWWPGREEELKRICAPYEYVIGSIHFLEFRPIDNSDEMGFWEEQGVDGVWSKYFESWLAMAQSDVPFDCFGHPDLPKKYNKYPSFSMDEYFAAMAEATAKKGCMVEVNTAGLRKEVHELYPSLQLLRMFREAGVECTVGCDAHCPGEIGRDVDKAYAWMKQAGYEYVTVPTVDGSRRQIRLED